MKTIYILFGDIDYEGSTILAVLESEEEAEALKKWGEENKSGNYPQLNYGYDGLRIEKWGVGERNDRIPKNLT